MFCWTCYGCVWPWIEETEMRSLIEKHHTRYLKLKQFTAFHAADMSVGWAVARVWLHEVVTEAEAAGVVSHGEIHRDMFESHPVPRRK